MSTTTPPEPWLEGVSLLGEMAGQVPKLEGVPTGVEGLDDLFFTTEWEGDTPRQKPLGGIPRYAVMQVTGVSDTGKSLMVEQFVLEQARRGQSAILFTLESPAPFVAMALQHRARAMGIDYQKVENRIVLIDGATHTVLRTDLPTIFSTLAYAIRTYRVTAVAIDSLTGLYEAREMTARDIVRPIFSFLKKWHQTALLVSQKRSGHEAMTAEAAGGFAVGHILDGTMVLAKQVVTSYQTAGLYGVPVGELVRLFRIDGCRLSGHDTRTHFLEITPTGLVRIGPPLGQAAEGEGA